MTNQELLQQAKDQAAVSNDEIKAMLPIMDQAAKLCFIQEANINSFNDAKERFPGRYSGDLDHVVFTAMKLYALLAIQSAREEKWIPVEESLPDCDDVFRSELCLVASIHGTETGYYDYYRKSWIDEAGFDNSHVTHWMPMPKLTAPGR